MATENQYVPQVVDLRGGLDFVTPKLTASPGSLSDCYNFEEADRQGYVRSLGYERFDGDYAPSLAYTNSITLTHQAVTYSGSLPEPRSPLYYAKVEKPFGILISRGATSSVIAITDFEQASLLISFLKNPSGVFNIYSQDGSTTWPVTGYTNNSGADAQATTVLRNNQFQSLSGYVDTIDSSISKSPVIGLRWYKNQLYAIRNLNSFTFDAGSTEVFANETLTPTATSSDTLKILDVQVTSGTWAAGTAAGTILTHTTDGSDITGSMDLVERGISGVLNITTVQPTEVDLLDTITSAGIWRTYSREQADAVGITPGWHPVDTGYQVTFTGGTSAGPPLLYSRGEVSSVTSPVAVSGVPQSAVTSGSVTWTLEGGAATALEALVTDDQKYIQGSTTAVNPVTLLQVTGFANAESVPASATMTGFSLKLSIAAETVSSTKNPYFFVRPISASGELGTVKATPYVRKTAGTFSGADIYVLGGELDTWGVANLQAELANGFGFNIVPRVAGTGSSSIAYRINFVELTVYYTATSQGLFVWNGTEDVAVQAVNYYVDEGDWTTDDAHGFMQLYNLTAVGSGTKTYIEAGDQIRTLPGGAGALIATAETNAIASMLPGLKSLIDNESRYQMLVANFYPTEEWSAIYGVNGASRGFSYDGYYFRWLYTSLTKELDKPRHVEFFQRHLIIGYKAGNIKISKVGFPEIFNVDQGGGDIPTGDRITGLIRLEGATLAIACQNSIQSLLGSSLDDFSLRVLNPYDGAIEYTVANCGRPVYCSKSGITLFEQTAAYGDFSGVRLSEPVAAWLTPRLQGRTPPINIFASNLAEEKQSNTLYIEQTASVGPLMAYPCRSKNQYRLVFKDGSILTMTLRGPAQAPSFTFQARIMHRNGDAAFVAPYSNFIPRAECSAIDELGRERIHMSHYNEQLDPTGDGGNSLEGYHVYEFERSWTDDGRGIPAYLVTNPNFKDSPFMHGKLAKVKIHGLSLGYAPCKLFVSKNYESADPYGTSPEESQVCDLPRTASDTLTADLIPTTSAVNYQKEGWCLNMNFLNYTNYYNDSPFGFKLADPSPPFALQTLLIQYTPTKGGT